MITTATIPRNIEVLVFFLNMIMAKKPKQIKRIIPTIKRTAGGI